MTAVSEAVVLMAGPGSRLRAGGYEKPKPLTELLGRPLVTYIFESLGRVGIKTIHAVVGYRRKTLIPQLERTPPAGLTLNFIENKDWEKQNGISVLAARNHVRSPFLLTMADHLFDDAIVDLTMGGATTDGIGLAVDRKLRSIFDIDDAMKVQTQDERIVAIGKDLKDYDAIDTGMFVCSSVIFDFLEAARRDGDCSLAEGVRAAAKAGKVRAIDIGDAWWQDVDTKEMFAVAEAHLKKRTANKVSSAYRAR